MHRAGPSASPTSNRLQPSTHHHHRRSPQSRSHAGHGWDSRKACGARAGSHLRAPLSRWVHPLPQYRATNPTTQMDAESLVSRGSQIAGTDLRSHAASASHAPTRTRAAWEAPSAPIDSRRAALTACCTSRSTLGRPTSLPVSAGSRRPSGRTTRCASAPAETSTASAPSTDCLSPSAAPRRKSAQCRCQPTCGPASNMHIWDDPHTRVATTNTAMC